MSGCLLNEIIKEIDVLISPITGTSLFIEDGVFQKVNESFNSENLECLKGLHEPLTEKNPFKNEQWWKFLCSLMEKLLQLKTILENANEKQSLLSIQQQTTIKSSLEILFSLGIIAHLSQGIGISLEARSAAASKGLLPDVNPSQKTYSLHLVLRCVLSLREEDTFKKLISTLHLGDCLAAIFQLLLNRDELKCSPAEKVYFEKQLSHLLEETFQPLLIKELMLLYGNEKCPRKLSNALRLIMIERLMKENGVLSTSKAILDVAGDQYSPKQWRTISVIAKLISTPHESQQQIYRDKVYPQILKLLSTSEVQYAQIAVLCVLNVFESDPEVCHKYFIDKICKPLLQSSAEDNITLIIDTLYNCVGVPSSQHWALPSSLFKNIHVALFRLYCFVVNSATHLKNKLRKIVISILSKEMDYVGFVFGEVNLKFHFGDQGGVYTETSDDTEITPWGDATDILLDLMETDELKVELFKAVIPTMKGELERRLVGARVLSELCTSAKVLKWIEEEPLEIVNFIISLLEENCEDEIVCLGLMVLSIILNHDSRSKSRNWSVFDKLVEPLKKFKGSSKNVELRVLADEIYCMILTRGVIKKKNPNDEPLSSKEEQLGHCAKALKEVNDPLLPVRANAIRILGKLITSRDIEAHENKEKILCILKSNLKEDDSYVYLSAVESLACLASTYPDEVLLTLTEQFVHCKISETRLKIGEVLMRVIRNLGEMAAVYKNEIINALLFGCRDTDHTVRASSLSNLGELCRILSFRIHAFMIEIFDCMRCIFETDKAHEPRRAAVMLLTSLLKGLGPDVFSVLEPILIKIYRLLKYIYNHDKDDITKLHAQLAIEELNSSTLLVLCPPQKLEKNIFVLHPPK